MSSTAVIRVATAGDVPALLALIGEYWDFEGIDGFSAARVEPVLVELLSKPDFGCVWLVDDGAEAAGYLVAVYVFSIEHAGLTAEIDELFLRPAWRRGGLGRRLLGVAEEEFARTGCTNVSFQLGRTNEEARRFYEKCGYTPRNGYELMDKMLGTSRPS